MARLLNPPCKTRVRPAADAGFTLVEVLVALVVMSLMAVLTWQGMDGMAKATSMHRDRSDEVAAVQTALAQWRADLDALIDPSQTPPVLSGSGNSQSAARSLEFDGRILRMTRRFAGDELRVIAWGSREVAADQGSVRRFARWVSEPVRTRGQWQTAWDQAARWGQSPGAAEIAQETPAMAVQEWQIFFYRNDAWSNAQSSEGAALPANIHPDGVRLILKLAEGQAPGGQLTLDWVQPTKGGKS
jgi:general secretion pathway protein J